MKLIIPYSHATNVFEIDLNFYKKIGVSHILLDLDNTLEVHNVSKPSKQVFELFKKMEEENLIPIVVSNNSEKRVKKYISELNCRYISRAGKPFGNKIKKYLENNNIQLENVIMIGDQLVTDIRFANRIGIKSILVEKLSDNDQFITQFLKWYDTKMHKTLKENSLLVNRRDIYGRIK